MTIRVKMLFEGETLEGSFTINAPTATPDDLVRYAVEFCRENDTQFLGVL